VELRLGLDAAGRVVKVEVLRAPRGADRARLEKALLGLAAVAAPSGAATYQVLARVG
jgi:hypothetical protein